MGIISESVSFQGWGSFRGRDHFGVGIISGAVQYRRHTAGGVTPGGLASCPGGVAILLDMLHATETGISSGRLGLWLVCAFIFSAI